MRSLVRSDLRVAQQLAHEFITKVWKCAVFADMGLGKTGAVIMLLVDLFNRFEIGCVLVIAPLPVATWVWPNELRLWTDAKYLTNEVLWRAKPGQHTPTKHGEHRLRYWQHKVDRLSVEIAERKDHKDDTPRLQARYSLAMREWRDAKRTLKWGLCAACRPADIHIINRENSVWLVHFWGKYWPYDVVVYDESSDLKNGKRVLRWRAMRKIMGVCRRFIALTGTPAPKGLIDLWAQIYVLDGGARLGRTITEYRKQYFTADYSGFAWEPRPEAMVLVTAAISDICITLSADDFMDLPPTLYNAIPVSLSDEEMEKYKTMEREYIVELSDGGEIEAVTSAVLSTKLLQLANGLIYDGERLIHRFHSKKISALADYIEEQQGHNVLVAYYFKHDLEAIRAAFPHARLFGKDEALIEEWNAGTVPLMLIHPASGGHGLNIQFGGRRLLWFGPIPTRDLELYQQMNDRLAHARAVGLGTTFIDHLCAVGTIDYLVLDTLERKATTQTVMRNHLKSRHSTES